MLPWGRFPSICSRQTAMGMRRPCCSVATRRLRPEPVTRESQQQSAFLLQVNPQGKELGPPSLSAKCPNSQRCHQDIKSQLAKLRGWTR